MTAQEIAIGISIVTAASAAVNVYVGLRVAAIQAKMKADSSALEVSIIKQFVAWKDDVLTAINGKYVSDKLIGEIRTSLGREMSALSARMDHIEKRCDERCMSLHCHPPE